MKKMILAVGLLAMLVQAGFGQEDGQSKWQVGFYGESWMLMANGFGTNIRSSSGRPGYLDFAFTFCPGTWEDHSALFALHLSGLFKIGKKSGGGVFIGPGISWSPSILIPVLHLKAAVVIPLNKAAGIELGSYPVLAGFFYPYLMVLPNIHAGFYVRF